MYMYKDVNATVSGPKIKLSRYFDYFSFYEYLNGDNAELMRSEIAARPELAKNYADFAASVIAKLASHASTEENRKNIIMALETCRDILGNHGYKEIGERNLDSRVARASGVQKNTVMVAGCQSPKILFARVKAAAHVVHHISPYLDIVFSGSRPNNKEVIIQDESERMDIMFDRLIKDGFFSETQIKRMNSIRFYQETQSTTTRENIQRLFEDGHLVSPQKGKSNVYLVSSTFHLPRLAAEVEKYLNTSEFKQYINFIVLCGADDLNDPIIPTGTPGYLKTLYFELYHYLLQQDIFFKD